MKTKTLKIDEKLMKELHKHKQKTGKNIKWTVEEAVRQYFLRHRWNRG